MNPLRKTKAARMAALKLATENYKLWRDEILLKESPRAVDSMRLRVLQENLAQLAIEALT